MSDPKPLRPPFVEVFDALCDLTLLEASEVVKRLEHELGVSATAGVIMPPGETSQGVAFTNPPGPWDDVVWCVESFGPARRDVILALRRMTGQPLDAILALERAPGAWSPAPFRGDRLFEIRDALRALGAAISIRTV